MTYRRTLVLNLYSYWTQFYWLIYEKVQVLRYAMLCNFSRSAHIKTPCQYRENISRNGFTNRDGLNKQTKTKNHQTKLEFKLAVSESSDLLLKLTVFNYYFFNRLFWLRRGMHVRRMSKCMSKQSCWTNWWIKTTCFFTTSAWKFSCRYISDRIRKNMPAVDSKTVPVARSVQPTPLARKIPPPPPHASTWQGPLQQGAKSTQNIQASPNNSTNTVNNKTIWHSNWQV